MSSQDHRSSQSAPIPGGEQNCTHHQQQQQQMHRPISPPVPKITRIPPPAPKLTNITSVEPSTEHNCTCTHHHNILTQHYHHHHHHHPSNCTQNVGFGQSRQHQMSQAAQQHEHNNEPNQSAVETHNMLTSHHANVGHHSNIPYNLGAGSPNMCQSCECGQNSAHEQSGRSSRIVSTDENNPSGSEDSGRKCSNRTKKITNAEQRNGIEHKLNENSVVGSRIMSNRSDEMKCINRIERYSDIVEAAMKNTDADILTEEELGPPLPPRPPPRIRNVPSANDIATHSTGLRKYVFWCLICGGISCLLGVMFLGVYFLVRSYTSTVGYFETVPATLACRDLKSVEEAKSFKFRFYFNLLLRGIRNVKGDPEVIDKSSKLYRGCNVLFPKLIVNEKFLFKQFTSTSLEKKKAEDFLGHEGTLFIVDGINHGSIGHQTVIGLKNHSAFPTEAEVLINPFLIFTITKIEKAVKGIVHVHLEVA